VRPAPSIMWPSFSCFFFAMFGLPTARRQGGPAGGMQQSRNSLKFDDERE